jgi:hypothetical protein
MAKWSFNVGTFTPTANADTSAMTTLTFMALLGGSTTQQINVIEIYQAGLNTSSAVNSMVFARDSTVGVGASALASPNTNGPLNPNTAALAAPQSAYVTVATTFPQRSSVATLARLNLSFNSFGGIVRWVAAPGEEWQIYGNAASAGESSLSTSVASAGAESAFIIYEPF